MMLVLALLIAFVMFDLIALRWGTDSTEDIDSCEWIKRKNWGII